MTAMTETSAWQWCFENTYSTRHEWKPRFHDGTVTVDTDKYRLVEIPPSGHEPPDVKLTRILVSTSKATIKSSGQVSVNSNCSRVICKSENAVSLWWPCHSFCCRLSGSNHSFQCDSARIQSTKRCVSMCMDCCCIFSVPGWASYKLQLHHSFITSESQPLLLLKLHCVRTSRTAASPNCYSCQFADKQAESGYYNKSKVLCVK